MTAAAAATATQELPSSNLCAQPPAAPSDCGDDGGSEGAALRRALTGAADTKAVRRVADRDEVCSPPLRFVLLWLPPLIMPLLVLPRWLKPPLLYSLPPPLPPAANSVAPPRGEASGAAAAMRSGGTRVRAVSDTSIGDWRALMRTRALAAGEPLPAPPVPMPPPAAAAAALLAPTLPSPPLER